MPPIRTFTGPAKPMKTERTHEENQERAYIAASRRSDRSLEARVESARRASEIHKRRTGRALRVTEQDVVNEEMYEEEDEDLPMQYRRLAAHLNAGSSGFNRRLAAYLTHHIAMRSALGQAISDANQQFPNPTDFSSIRQQPWSESPQQMEFTGVNLPAQMPHQSPQSYGHSPYPMSPPRPAVNRRLSSIAAVQSPPSGNEFDGAQSASKNERRASEPLMVDPPTATGKPPDLPAKPSSVSPEFRIAAPSLKKEGEAISNPLDGYGHAAKSNSASASSLPHIFPQQNWTTDPPFTMGPLSTAMPRETLMYPGLGFDPSNPFGNLFFETDEKTRHPLYSFGHQGPDSSSSLYPSFRGMDQTLAPDLVGTDSDQYHWPEDNTGTLDLASPATYGFDQSYGFEKKDPAMSDGAGGNGDIAPSVDSEWANFIDESTWE